MFDLISMITKGIADASHHTQPIQRENHDMNDLIENPSPRCACALVLDTSGSMGGAPINELNAGLSEFLRAVSEDEMAAYSVELAIFTAGGRVSEELPFTTVANLGRLPTLSARGDTPLGEAVELALSHLDQRKVTYQRNGVPYYQPWLVIISDGSPTDDWHNAAAQAKALSSQSKLVSLPIGVSGADLRILSQFSSKPAKELSGLKFREFFEWLSASMSRVSASNSTSSSVNLPKTDSWDSI